nr:MAG TPA: hypothetical protein [Caudoviricetes sp.]
MIYNDWFLITRIRFYLECFIFPYSRIPFQSIFLIAILLYHKFLDSSRLFNQLF